MTCSPKTELKREDNMQCNIHLFVTHTPMSDDDRHTQSLWESKTQGLPEQAGSRPGSADTKAQAGRKRRRHPGGPGIGIERLHSCARGSNPGTMHRSGAGDSRVQQKECRPEHEWGRRWSGKAGKEGAVTGP